MQHFLHFVFFSWIKYYFPYIFNRGCKKKSKNLVSSHSRELSLASCLVSWDKCLATTLQATVQNAHAETHFQVHPYPRLVCSDWPEGHVLSCLDSSSTQAVSELCVRGSSISVQGPALRVGPVSLCLHESRGESPCSHERTGHSHPQLFRRLAHSCSVLGAVKRTQGFGAQSPQLVGPSGQLGKEQTSPSAEDLFSWYGVGFGQTVSMPHRGTCSVGVELPEYIQWQDSGPTETISEAPGAYGSRSNPASFSSYETASALASRPSPEMGGPRITPVCRQAFSPWLDP